MALRVEDVRALPRELAALVLVARTRFNEVYDELWKELQAGDAAGIYGGETFLSAVLDDDLKAPVNDVEAFMRAFAVAETGGWLKQLVGRCLERAAIDDSARALFRRRAAAPERTGEKTVLQAVVDRLKGWDDPNALAYGLQRTMPKICLVRVDTLQEKSQGTGFLVSPQTVLTAWHVIAPLLDANGRPLEGSDRWLSVEFDFIDPLDGGSAQKNVKSYEVVQRWLSDHSPCYAAERPTAAGIRHTLKSRSIKNAQLDFAVIRLKGSPGRERGWVKLPSDAIVLKKGGLKLLVFQHPNRFPQRVSDGQLTKYYGSGKPAPRFRHLANSAAGSSGGLCVDSRFQCVGLHQAAVVDEQDNVIANQAVPASLISPQLAAAYEVEAMHDPLTWLGDTQLPVIGREPFQEAVWKVTRGEKRAIIVRGQSRHGLSFSEQILRSLLPPRDTLVVKFTADQIGRDAIEFATRLLDACGGKLPAGEQFPPKASAATAVFAWIRDQLLVELAKRLAKVAMGRQVWIVVDDLHRHTVPEDDAYTLLTAVIAAERDAPFIRGLFIGLESVPVQSQLYEPSLTNAPLSGEIDAYLQRYFTRKDRHVDAAQRGNYVQMVMRAVNNSADTRRDPWATAVRFIVDNMHPIGDPL